MAWYVQTFENYIEVFETAAKAEAFANSALQEVRDTASDGWPESMTTLEWGELQCHAHCRQICEMLAPQNSGFDTVADFGLLSAIVPEMSRVAQLEALLTTMTEMLDVDLDDHAEIQTAVQTARELLAKPLEGWQPMAPGAALKAAMEGKIVEASPGGDFPWHRVTFTPAGFACYYDAMPTVTRLYRVKAARAP